jgi:O-antigen/teichoic acid export membrane protein
MSKGDSENTESGLWTVLRESSFVFVASMVSMALGFGANFVMARWFGAEVVGRFALVQSVVNIASILTVFGLDVGLIKYIPRLRSEGATERIRQTVGTVIVVATLLSIAVALLIVLGRDFIAVDIFGDPALTDLLLIGAILLLPVTLLKILSGLYRAFKKAGLQRVLGDIGYRTFFCLAMVALAVTHIQTTDWVLGAYLCSHVFAVALLFFFARKFDQKLFTDFGRVLRPNDAQREDRSELVKFSSTMILISVMSFLLAKTDILMVGYFKDSSEVGIYKIAVLIANLLRFVFASANAIFPSIISELYTENRLQELEKMYSTITKWSLVVAMPIMACMVFFPLPLVEVFGKEYATAASALSVLAIGNFCNVAVGSNGHILKMSGHERLVLLNNVLLAVFNIGLNLYLIPRFGTVGAAIATASAIAIISAVKVVELKWLLGIFPYHLRMLPLVGSAFVVAGVGFLTASWTDSVWKVVVMGVVFGIVTLAGAVPSLDKRDKDLLARARSKFSP